MDKYSDLIGHNLEVGDLVAYPTGSGSTKYMCVAKIVEFLDREPHPYARYLKSFSVRLQPLFWTDHRSTTKWGYKDGEYQVLERDIPPKQVVVDNTHNLVKVVPPSGEEGE